MKNIINIYRKFRARFRMIETSNKTIQQVLFNQRKYILEQNILRDNTPGISEDQYCDHEIIVSLTTHGKRIYDVHLTIESIMEQTMKANRIILWLDYNFKHKTLPKTLQLLQKRGLEISFCKDIRSYTKIILSLIKFPNDAIVTIDDDVLYEIDLLENLITAYQENPSYIYCTRFHRILLDKNHNLLPYRKWQWLCPDMDANVLNFPTGVGGVLYPPHSLDEEVLNESIFMDICTYADDVWLKAMALKKGTLSKKVYTHSSEDFLMNEEVQDIGLRNINIENDFLNDKQISTVFQKYNLYQILR
ncbi:glycosyltransferase family A protein [Parabacteroides distasonis]|uniref:glycosyltransferase family A protein n=1 Tax=Parabacteroides distasonis TaxID=823 RepID=UPI001E4009ED|nr:glycosyltransferase family A protein [Parabacteroides distasonis]MDB9027334.1 glycosyltransferase family A protein [Parabacteroides distasonis]MDB9044077.1 glycosyltransferase family A protein [Parabacteroides distasonis]MDB9091957.1 glycosyltransferase family A protein [Parabacteroides distasonis]MDB9162276.1 glycosyltransferase family A protein [Parabacteroides distasonis]